MTRARLLWSLRDVLRQVRRVKVWWAVHEPSIYGAWMEDL